MQLSLRIALLCVAGLGGACADRLSGDGGGSTGLGAGSPPGGGGPLPSEAPPESFALVSAAGGAGAVRVDWRAPGEPGPTVVALFVGADPTALFSEPPAAVDPGGDSLVLDGLPTGGELFVGLGLGEPGATRYEPSGPVLRVRAGLPIYVDPLADPDGADGESPATAFPELILGTLTALVTGRPVWVAGGEFEDVSVTLFGGVHLAGGFGPDFDLVTRDPAGTPTRLRGRAGAPIVAVQSGVAAGVVLDGFELDGLGVATDGVSVPSTPAELRALSIEGCARGIKLRAAEAGVALPVTVTGCSVRENALEGLSAEGAFDLVLESSRFETNGQEGVDLNKLVAPDGGSASLVARACRFADNAFEGLDADLAAPAAGGATGGRFVVHLERCDFVANALDGALVDLDFEFSPLWEAEVLARGCQARANGEAGVHLDLDAPVSAFVHRLTSSANRAEGFLVTSESTRGTATLSASVLLGNGGAGARATLGNVPIIAGNCAFTGNAAGGLTSDTVTSVAVSCVAHLQPAPFTGAHVRSSVVTADPLDPPFVRVPREFVSVIGATGSALLLGSQPASGAGASLEVTDDGVLRSATLVGAGSVIPDPFPQLLRLPTVAAFFDPGSPVDEDFRLGASSAARGAGLSLPFGPPTDAGPFGSPAGGEPGTEDLRPAPLFYFAGSEPPWTLPLASDEPLALDFAGGVPDPASLPTGVLVTGADGLALEAPAWIDAERLIVAPPVGGWPAGASLELHAPLATAGGTGLAAPLVLPLTTR